MRDTFPIPLLAALLVLALATACGAPVEPSREPSVCDEPANDHEFAELPRSAMPPECGDAAVWSTAGDPSSFVVCRAVKLPSGRWGTPMCPPPPECPVCFRGVAYPSGT